jgi:hypothetical protein
VLHKEARQDESMLGYVGQFGNISYFGTKNLTMVIYLLDCSNVPIMWAIYKMKIWDYMWDKLWNGWDWLEWLWKRVTNVGVGKLKKGGMKSFKCCMLSDWISWEVT